MRIDFQEITIKNFFSYGAKPTTLKFNEFPLNLVIGANGKGKSSLLVESIFFALFGKPSKALKIKSVINEINKKNCVVDLKFIVNHKIPCRIVRGLNPNFIEFYKGDEKEDSRSSKKLMQKEIENYIQLSSETLSNICILSANQSKSFLDMQPNESRPVIENLFGIYVFSLMLQEVKNQRTSIIEKSKNISSDLNLFNKVLSDYKTSMIRMRELRENFEKEKKEKISKLEVTRETIKDEILINNFRKEELEGIDKLFFDCRNKILELEKEEVQKKNDIKHSKELIKIIEEKINIIDTNEICPICASTLNEKLKKKEIETNLDSKRNIEGLINDNKEKINDIELKLKELKISLNKFNSDSIENQQLDNIISNLDNDIIRIDDTILKLKSDTIDKHISNIIDISKVKEYVEKKKCLEQEQIELNRDLAYQDTIKNILSDEGVKSAVIRRDLPFLNTKINEYLRKIGFNINICFNETFDLIIENPRKSFYQYHSFSNGQKKRIDLAILLSFMDLAKRKNSINTNLLVLDEFLDSSLDSDGIADFIRILNIKIKESALNVFIISHKTDLVLDNCSRVEIKQEGEFSVVNIS